MDGSTLWLLFNMLWTMFLACIWAHLKDWERELTGKAHDKGLKDGTISPNIVIIEPKKFDPVLTFKKTIGRKQ